MTLRLPPDVFVTTFQRTFLQAKRTWEILGKPLGQKRNAAQRDSDVLTR